MTTTSASIDIDDPRAIAGHIWAELPDAATYGRAEKYAPVAVLGTEWCVEHGPSRFYIGPDPREDGLCWALWRRQDGDWEPAEIVGGWAPGDRETADAEIAQVIAELGL